MYQHQSKAPIPPETMERMGKRLWRLRTLETVLQKRLTVLRTNPDRRGYKTVDAYRACVARAVIYLEERLRNAHEHLEV